jgi:RNA polymerase sigma-70 factor (ECF subfamily)
VRRYGLGPDAELIYAIRRGDRAAVAAFYERHLPLVWRYACWRLNDDIHAAQDVVSETFVEAVRGLRAGEARVPADGALLAWLTGIARNKVADCLRRRRSSHKALAAWAAKTASAGAQEPDPVADLQKAETKAQVAEVMNGLPDEERLVLELKYLEGLSVGEIAARLCRTEKAVESLLFRGRRSFRDSFQVLSGTQPGEETMA